MNKLNADLEPSPKDQRIIKLDIARKLILLRPR